MRTLIFLLAFVLCVGVLGEHGNEFQRGDVNEDGIDPTHESLDCDAYEPCD